MRGVTRWKQHFKYKKYIGSADTYDGDGYYTGEPVSQYGKKLDAYANISYPTGKASESEFGMNVEYDKVISTTDDLGITEQSVLWIDDLRSEKPDYVVRRVARSVLGIYRIAVAKIET